MIPFKLKRIAKKILPRPIYSALACIVFLPVHFAEWRYNRRFGMEAVRYIQNNRDEKIILLAGIHEWGNLGDHAICIAERKFLETRFPGALIVELATKKICPVAERIAAVHCKHLVVAVPGGGFLGNLWPSEEIMFRKMLRVFKENRIVVFPQTIFFDQNEKNFVRELAKSKAAYRSHKDLHIFIRDLSIDFLRSDVLAPEFHNLYNVPDIVLSLNRCQSGDVRNGILFCLRSDKEKVLSDSQSAVLIEAARKTKEDVRFTDTCEAYRIPPQFREFSTQKKFAEFAGAKLVVTDRLHGMIFAAVTGTPCVALDNISGKVAGVYNLWFSGIPYVRFANSEKEAASLIPNMLPLGGQNYDSSQFDAYWQKIEDAIRGGLE